MKRLPKTAVVLVLACATGLARNKPEALLDQAADATDIWTVSEPLQLKANITFFQMESGDMNGSATISWALPDRWREDISAPGFSETAIRAGGKSWRTASLDERPIRIAEFDWALRALARRQKDGPFAAPANPHSEYSTESRKINGVAADCVIVKVPSGNEFVCFGKGSDLPTEIGDEYGTYEYSDYQPWHGKTFPTTIRTIEDTGPVLEAHVTLSSQLSPESAFTPPPGAHENQPLAVRVSQGVLQPNFISKPDPIYPASARHNREQGTVVFSAIIGKDGKIKFLHLIQSAGNDLDQAAYDAVRRWIYKPYSLDGLPVEVHTHITVNFTLSGG